MKTYLNHAERQLASFFAICYGMIDSALEEWGDNISKEETTALKYSHTHLKKFIQALIKRVGANEGDRIYKVARDNKVELKPKNYDDGQLIVDKDSMEEVARMAVETHCFGCNRVDWRNCELCKFMDKLGIESLNDTKGQCEFRYDER